MVNPRDIAGERRRRRRKRRRRRRFFDSQNLTNNHKQERPSVIKRPELPSTPRLPYTLYNHVMFFQQFSHTLPKTAADKKVPDKNQKKKKQQQQQHTHTHTPTYYMHRLLFRLRQTLAKNQHLTLLFAPPTINQSKSTIHAKRQPVS